MRLGIMSAMNEEIEHLVQELRGAKTRSEGMRDYHEGTLWGTPAVLAFSRCGKVAAATTATHLISEYGVDTLIFTGVAGGAAAGVRVGDVIVGTDLCQHDMDARPLFPRHEIPLLGQSDFPTDQDLRARLERAARAFLGGPIAQALPKSLLSELGIARPEIRLGGIASGDRFFATREGIEELRNRLPGILCVEMEGAAVAQVCYEYGVRFGIIRTISDSADEHAPVDFPRFIREVARVYSHGILRELLTPPAP